MPRAVTSHHPAEVDLFDLAVGRMDRGEVFAARAHVERPCSLCTRRLAELQRTARALDDARERQAVVCEPLPFETREDAVRAAKRRSDLEDLASLSDEADTRSVALVDAAGSGPDALREALSALEGDASRPLTLLYAAQRAGKLAANDPNAALELARRLKKAAPSLPSASHSPKAPATTELLEGEALLLESHCLLAIGFVNEAIEKVVDARKAFVAANDPGFSEAVCDYFEGSAAGFAGRFARAERLLKNALGVFADFGQDQWMGRALAATGAMFSQRGDYRRSVEYIERGLAHLSPDLDANSYVASLVNRASGLIRLNRFDEARSSYAEALTLSLKYNLKHLTFGVRMGLAGIELPSG